MTSAPPKSPIYFGPFEVTNQVFMTTSHSFALVNLKPLLPGHVLVCPIKKHRRLTDLSPPELTDLFQAVQRVQHMLARHYFRPQAPPGSPPPAPRPEDGSFNIALQDGPEAGQTVSHVHVHVIPRLRDDGRSAPNGPGGDEVYEGMASERGNVGGALWDREVERLFRERGSELGWGAELATRPRPGGAFARIEDAERHARSQEEMEAEARLFRDVLRQMEREEAAL
ncbi:hypothetical protein VTK73DRAFT_8312 [Phialemonium thermophilum]|uniref:Bis(5'-adenosyl)-triphosphatase n=1 Tax=Phialemonium thermophilum TaxID=223376 RepID=A0ABR3Y673_9PEZI